MNANLTKANPKANPFDLSVNTEEARSKTTSPPTDTPVLNLNVNTTADALEEGDDTRHSPDGGNSAELSLADAAFSERINVVALQGESATDKDIQAIKVLVMASGNDSSCSGQAAIVVPEVLATAVGNQASATVLAGPAKGTAPASGSRTLLEKLGASNLPYADLDQLMKEAAFAAMDQRQTELKVHGEAYLEKAAALNFSDADAIARLKSLTSNRDLQRGGNQIGIRSSRSTDKNGQKPQAGVTYRHPDTGELWTKPRAPGRAPAVFEDAVQGDHCWTDMEAHSESPPQA